MLKIANRDSRFQNFLEGASPSETPLEAGARIYNPPADKYSCQYEHSSKNLSYAPEMENKTNRSNMYFTTKTFKFCFKIISFSSLKSEF